MVGAIGRVNCVSVALATVISAIVCAVSDLKCQVASIVPLTPTPNDFVTVSNLNNESAPKEPEMLICIWPLDPAGLHPPPPD